MHAPLLTLATLLLALAVPHAVPSNRAPTLQDGVPRESELVARLDADLDELRALLDDDDLDRLRSRLETLVSAELLTRLQTEALDAHLVALQDLDAFAVSANALEVLERVRAERVRLLATNRHADDLEHLSARVALAVVRRQLGDLAGAHAEFEAIHEAYSRLLPGDHSSLLNAKMNLAVTTRDLGDPETSLALLQAVQAVYLRILPADSEKLVGLEQALAATYYALGDIEQCAELMASVYEARKKTLPADHPELLRAKMNLALMRWEQRELLEAREMLEQVLDAQAKRLPEDHPDLLAVKTNLAVVLQDLGDAREALRILEALHAVRARQLPIDHPDLLLTKLNLAGARTDVGDLAGAMELEEEALAVWEPLVPADHPALVAIRLNLARSRLSAEDLDGALELAEIVHDACTTSRPPEHADVLDAREMLADVCFERGESRRALELYEQILDVQERLLPPDDPELLRSKFDLVGVLIDLGQDERAFELAQAVHAARELRLPPEHIEMIEAKRLLASTLTELGDFERAYALREQVLGVLEPLLPEGHFDLVEARVDLALTVKDMGDLERALALERSALATWSSSLHEDDLNLIFLRSHHARTRQMIGDPEGARVLLEDVIARLERLRPPGDQGLLIDRLNLAAVYEALDEWERALELYEQVYAIWSEQLPEGHSRLLQAEAGIAKAVYRTGDYARAHDLYERLEGLEKERVPEGHPWRVAPLRMHALTHAAMGDHPGALERYLECLSIAERAFPGDHREVLKALRDVIWMLRVVGRHDEATAQTRRLLEGEVARVALMGEQAPRVARASAREELERWTWVLSFSRGPEGEPVRDLARPLFQSLESLRLVSTTSVASALVLADDPELAELRDRLAATRRRINDQAFREPEDAAALEGWREDLLALAEMRDALQHELHVGLRERGLEPLTPTVRDVARGLEPDAALVCYLRYVHRPRPQLGDVGVPEPVESVIAFLVLPDGDLRWIELGPADAIEANLRAWRASPGGSLPARGVGVAPAPEEDHRTAGKDLRALVLDPILVQSQEGLRTLHVVADDTLHLIPIEALPTETGVVGDGLRVLYEPTVERLVRPVARPDGEPGIVLVGDVDYDVASSSPQGVGSPSLPPIELLAGARGAGAPLDFLPLEGAAAEIEAIGQLFAERFSGGDEDRVLELRGAEATKERLRRGVAGARFVHVATHGWFASDEAPSWLDATEGAANELERRTAETVRGFAPETLCGLALAGANGGADELGRASGLLTAEELATLDLSRCELAVLSACETNVGLRRAGQGIQSLRTALHAAGARTAITSLWAVDDRATFELMRRFYGYLWGEGMGKADALWKAKCDLRERGRPLREWAGWILSGEPD